MSSRIRVLLAEMPPMLRDIVKETVENQPDMMVVGDLGHGAAFRDAAERIGADVAIVGTSEPEDFSLPGRLLAALPCARVVMLCVAGRRAVMYELRPHRTALGEVSPQALIDAIRTPVTGHGPRQWPA